MACYNIFLKWSVYSFRALFTRYGNSIEVYCKMEKKKASLLHLPNNLLVLFHTCLCSSYTITDETLPTPMWKSYFKSDTKITIGMLSKIRLIAVHMTDEATVLSYHKLCLHTVAILHQGARVVFHLQWHKLTQVQSVATRLSFLPH